VSRQQRLAWLVQTGMLLSRHGNARHFDIVLQVPDESIPADVVEASKDCLKWMGAVANPYTGLFDAAHPIPPWIAEWLEREGRTFE